MFPKRDRTLKKLCLCQSFSTSLSPGETMFQYLIVFGIDSIQFFISFRTGPYNLLFFMLSISLINCAYNLFVLIVLIEMETVWWCNLLSFAFFPRDASIFYWQMERKFAQFTLLISHNWIVQRKNAHIHVYSVQCTTNLLSQTLHFFTIESFWHVRHSRRIN